MEQVEFSIKFKDGSRLIKSVPTEIEAEKFYVVFDGILHSINAITKQMDRAKVDIETPVQTKKHCTTRTKTLKASPELFDEVAAMRKKGMTYPEISKKYGKCRSWSQYIMRKYKASQK